LGPSIAGVNTPVCASMLPTKRTSSSFSRTMNSARPQVGLTTNKSTSSAVNGFASTPRCTATASKRSIWLGMRAPCSRAPPMRARPCSGRMRT
jgi:hypothetical protein